MFEDELEFNPGAAVIGVIGAGAVLIIMSNSPVGILWKFLGAIGGGVIGYIIGLKYLG